MVIEVRQSVEHCYTNEDGDVVGRLIAVALAQNNAAEVSFSGIDDVTTSFVNSAFVPLLDRYSLDYIKSHLRITNSTRQINTLIKDRLLREASRVAPAASR